MWLNIFTTVTENRHFSFVFTITLYSIFPNFGDTRSKQGYGALQMPEKEWFPCSLTKEILMMPCELSKALSSKS